MSGHHRLPTHAKSRNQVYGVSDILYNHSRGYIDATVLDIKRSITENKEEIKKWFDYIETLNIKIPYYETNNNKEYIKDGYAIFFIYVKIINIRIK